ncbi:ABC transporter substrate-binding protein [Deinococcus sonorensis]|uniref:ABC transporter substrate-binding protein n=2 Tax=Deinococcus sonorensis TaxID=309891 RepID=A0AAU7UBH4_9DEIO
MKPLLTLTLLLGTAGAAPTPVVFWHSMQGVSSLIEGYASDFNRSQTQYVVTAKAVGNYREAAARLQDALQAGTAPALFQAEFTTFTALAAQGQLEPLDRAADDLPPALTQDLYPAVWRAGEVEGHRYGLPWNVSVPVLYYNAGAFRKAGVSAPATWSELETAAQRLKTGGRRPLVAVADAWTFEGLVAVRGGQLVQGNRPAFDSPEAVAALEQLTRMVRAGTAQPRTLDQVVGAALDFTRGQNVMAVASIANQNDFARLPFIQLGVAPFPCEKRCAPPLGGANLVVPRGTPAAEQAGALAFWRYLMDPARLNSWVKATGYLSPRRSVQARLSSAEAPGSARRAAADQLLMAQPRPTAPQYSRWQPLLEAAISSALSGRQSAEAALQDAQRRATQP